MPAFLFYSTVKPSMLKPEVLFGGKVALGLMRNGDQHNAMCVILSVT
jgi:hypothetical protein